MKAHELARMLLEGPDVDVVIPDNEWMEVETVTAAREVRRQTCAPRRPLRRETVDEPGGDRVIELAGDYPWWQRSPRGATRPGTDRTRWPRNEE